jgi:hypothetical protein
MITPREEYEYWVEESKKTSVQYERYEYCCVKSFDAKVRFMKETDEKLEELSKCLLAVHAQVSDLLEERHWRNMSVTSK